MKQVLTILGEKDLHKLLQEQGEVAISCDFCNKNYKFDSIDIEMLFRS
jgi:molecular chaperone Hsp33